jgi:hypothetical protein
MISFRILATSGLAIGLAVGSSLASAQTSALQQKLESQYTLTKSTADRSDIVTAGSVLVLQKDNLLMDTTTSTVPMLNTYKNGKITHGVGDFLSCKWCKKIPGNSTPNVDTRTFVSGEKFWVTKIEIHDDGVFFELFSDPISDVRYYASLKFPVQKGSTPDPDQIQKAVAEVLKVQPADDAADSKDAAPAAKGAPAGGQQAAASAPAAAMAPIAAPPPPVDTPPPAPKTIALHQTKDEVVAIMGQPTKIVKLGTKEIDYYADMKVTFVGGKVADVQ